MGSQANMVPSILWLSVIISVSGTILNEPTRPLNANDEAGKYALGQAGKLKNCPGGFEHITDLKECQASATEFGKPWGKRWCFRNGEMKKACFEDRGKIYFTQCSFLTGSTPSSWRALCKDPNASAAGTCTTAADCPADLPTCHAEGFCHDFAKCKFVPAKKNECPGYESRLPKCHKDMSNGEFCDATQKLPDGNPDYDVRSCAGIWNTFKCVRGDFTVTEGACRTKDGEDDDVFSCDYKIASLSDCKAKCNKMAGCGAVSWDGAMCCGLSEKTTTTDETGWKCYDKQY